MRTKRFAAPVALAVALSVVPAMAEAIEAKAQYQDKAYPCGSGASRCGIWRQRSARPKGISLFAFFGFAYESQVPSGARC